MQKTDRWSEQISYYRFWNNENVTEEGLKECAIFHCLDQSKDVSHILLIQDTTELNLERHRGRIKDKSGLGVVGNNADLGFFCHPTLAINALDNSILGVAGIHLWHRMEYKLSKEQRQYKKQPIEEKESYRWIEQAVESKHKFSADVRLTVVQDREGDIYESFHRLQAAGLDFVIRSFHDRKIMQHEDKLKQHINHLHPSHQYELEVKGDNKKRKKRKALMDVRYEKITLERPSKIINSKDYPSGLSLYVVQVKEKQESVPSGEKPIEWTLYTTHEVNNENEALQVVGYYVSRWLIEELFRTVKTEGIDYESSELESGNALRKLFVMALMAAVQILQLRQARFGNTSQKTSLVFSQQQVTCMKDLLPHFEGKTEKQKNPFDPDNLAWATWVIARLGGWKGYSSQRPPGVITLHDGWIRFQNIFEGWNIAKKDVYNR